MQHKTTPWGSAEKEAWFQEQKIQRSYNDEVLEKISALREQHEVISYGALSLNVARYPLFMVKTKQFSTTKPTVLITGGVHGYETSGVQGALEFMLKECRRFSDFNVLCFPCISPWGYETINRWNPRAIDPNRSFHADSPCEESAFFLQALAPYLAQIVMHIDLHETTDTDNTVFRPAKAARDGFDQDTFSEIPDGFYLVGDTTRPAPDFQRAIIAEVRQVTHIAPPDAEGKIIGVELAQEGVVNYDKRKLFLCGGVTNAAFVTTTEVYPDSPKTSAQNCIDAQVAAIRGALAFMRAHR